MSEKNKVQYGLKNVHYSIVTETTNQGTGNTTSSYSAPKLWPGDVNISFDPNGEDTPFRADDMDYYNTSVNNGYTGTFESALVPDEVEIDVYGQTKDANGVITETANDVKKYIALSFEVKGDKAKRRFLFYRVMLSRHTVGSATTDTTITPGTTTVNFTASPRPDDEKVKSYCYEGDAAYSGWFNAVYQGGDPIPSIDIQPKIVKLADGETFDLSTQVVPAGQVIAWTSSASGVATVAAGTITAEGVGDAIITGTITVDNVEYSDSVTVIVEE